jgi:glycosyltransferase involved in cell wall biosynthesis
MQKKLAMVRNVLFHGEVEKSSEFLEIADIMVAPILSGSGMRVKIIEAMSYGKVVVTTTIGAEGIPVVSGEHLIIADNPLLFAQHILDLFAQPQKLEMLSKNAVNFIRQTFDNRTIARRVNDFYLQLLQSNE